MFAWVMATALAVGAPGLKDPPAPRLEGRWAAERYERDGQVREGDSLQGYVYRYAPRACTLEIGGSDVASEAVSYPGPAKGPNRIDFQEDGQKPKLGIWKIDGDTLTVCESAPGGDRPTDFTAPKGSGRSLWVVKRVKD